MRCGAAWCYETFIATAPAVTMKIEVNRAGVMRSLRNAAARIIAKTTDVSRSAATNAIGAGVMPQGQPEGSERAAPADKSPRPLMLQVPDCVCAVVGDGCRE